MKLKAGESKTTPSTRLGMLKQLGEDTWFNLGDKDLATHIYRTNRLHQGATLTQDNRGNPPKLRRQSKDLAHEQRPI